MKYFLFLCILVLFTNCEHTINKSKKEIAKEIIVNAKNCALITIDTSGVAHARTMDPFLPEENFIVWMATNPKSIKVKQLLQNPNTTLYYFDAKTGSYVTLQGTSETINTQKHKDKYWKKDWENFYKNNTTDFMLIKFTPKSGTIISEKYGILGDSITWKTPTLKF